MNKDRFIALTKQGEGNQIEYKTCREEVSESLYETVCSFLNHTGGHILMGVTDDGEIVGNLCVHADFSSGYACFFHVFKDRVVTKNPTRLLSEIPEGEMKIEINNGSQFLFSIANMDVNVPESKGMSETNVRNEVPLNEEELSVRIEESGAVKERRNRRRQGVISLIAQIPGITIETLADKLGTNEKTIRRDLAELREQGVIRRVGGSRFGGHWEITKLGK